MKSILVISFDMLREGECSVSYSTASLLASLKCNTTEKLNITCWSFNVLQDNFRELLYARLASVDLNSFENIAISVFVWSDSTVKKLLKHEKFVNYKGKIILGGKQIAGDEKELIKDYPLCRIFVLGYGESCITEAINCDNDVPKFLYGSCENMNMPSPYLANELSIAENQKMVRMETKRGCPYSCSFCAHRNLNDNTVKDFPHKRIVSELDLFKRNKIEKINIIDPVFNAGDKYLEILEYIYDNRIDSEVALQAKFELIKGKKGERFLDLCSKLRVTLEFGVQSMIESECRIVGRKNDYNHIKEIVGILHRKEINYEISLIYGLPEQTLETFRKTLADLDLLGVKKIKMYPLMLLRGTELYNNKEKWKLKEKSFEHDIPLVVESNSFPESEWQEMRKISANLRCII